MTMQALRVNSTLQGGKYRIIKKLGQGGFGITYLAENTLLEGKVAIKEFFFKEYCERDDSTSRVTIPTSGNREIVERFKQKFMKEAKTIFRLNHPNIVRILDVFEENGTAYYVMEYIEGESLSDMVTRRGAIPFAEAIGYVKAAAEALMYIHSKKINHLDIKPGNLMKRNDVGEIVLIDFGVAKQYDLATSQGTTTTPVGISCGYSPTEQYRKNGVQTFSPQSDVYSLAATLFKLLTGNTPPEAMEIQDEGLPVAELQAKHIPSTVISAIAMAMKGRHERTQSVELFVANLQKTEEAPKEAYQSQKTEIIQKEPLTGEDEIEALKEAEAQAMAEARAKVAAARKAREKAERKAREEAERKAEKERKAREEAERKIREARKKAEAERKAREEAEIARKAREEAERKAREEAEQKAREEAARIAHEVAIRKAREEAEAKVLAQAKAMIEAERKAREAAEAKAVEATRKAEAEREAREQAERIAREKAEAERVAREEAARIAREKAETERKAKEEAERRALEDAKRKVQEARMEAERKAKEEAERKAKEEAERRALEDAKRKVQEARMEAERKAKEEAERRAKAEAERKVSEMDNGKKKGAFSPTPPSFRQDADAVTTLPANETMHQDASTAITSPAEETNQQDADTVVTPAAKETTRPDAKVKTTYSEFDEVKPKSKKWVWISLIAVVVVGIAIVIYTNLYYYGEGNAMPQDSIAFGSTDSVALRPTSVENEEIVLNKGHETKRRFVYSGEVDEEGLPDGVGKAYYHATASCDSCVFEGTFVHGITSEGEMRFTNGNSFKGTFTEGGYYKQGTWVEKDGYYFEGTFKEGVTYNGTWYTPKGKKYSKVVDGKSV